MYIIEIFRNRETFTSIILYYTLFPILSLKNNKKLNLLINCLKFQMGACTSNKKEIDSNSSNKPKVNDKNAETPNNNLDNKAQPQPDAKGNNEPKKETPNAQKGTDTGLEKKPLVEQKSYFQKKLEEKNIKTNTVLVNPIHVFNPTQSLLQSQTNTFFANNFNSEGECITISFGNSFDVFNSFYESLYKDHNLDGSQPQYSYSKFFSDTIDGEYIPRGFAYEIPDEQSEIFTKSIIGNSYHQYNINFCNQTQDDREIFINSYLNDSKSKKVEELLRKEAEKCHNIHQILFISDIFNGSAMGLLSSFLYLIQNNYKKVLKVAHLKYYDTYAHKAFSKRKNYIFSVANLYKECSLINLFNSLRPGDVMNNLTIGDRISEYSSKFGINKILSSILIDPKANFVYSNGLEVEKNNVDACSQFVFFDCKEGRNHLSYYSQYSSLCIYKGNNYITDKQRIFFDKEISKIVNKKLQSNKGFYSFIEINKPFKYDFVSNIHQSNLFKDMTEEYLLDFLQSYNLHNFSSEEKEMREDTIYKVNEVVNYYKEMWKLVK